MVAMPCVLDPSCLRQSPFLWSLPISSCPALTLHTSLPEDIARSPVSRFAGVSNIEWGGSGGGRAGLGFIDWDIH